MRAAGFGVIAILAVLGCEPQAPPVYAQYTPYAAPAVAVTGPRDSDPGQIGQLDATTTDFVFDGGRLEFELRRDGDRVIQIARSRYAVPVMVQWTVTPLDNLAPQSLTSGVVLLPAAPKPLGKGQAIRLADFQLLDPALGYRRNLVVHARFGDPQAQPTPYAYHLPYKRGAVFSVLQGFHGAFSHRGSNEFAIDFDCPVATPVVATRPGIVVATNARAQGSGTSAEYLELKRVNFVLVLHDDGTLGEYMHLAPSGILVKAGQRVERGDELALSGNTGFSSTPHLHFQVMTAADDGVSARSFPFQLALGPQRAAEPVQGQAYMAWE